MSIVYVLRSTKSGKKYVGSTWKEPLERLAEHNAGKVPWTKSHRPLEIIYTEDLGNILLAQKRERFLKTGKGRKILDSLLDKK